MLQQEIDRNKKQVNNRLLIFNINNVPLKIKVVGLWVDRVRIFLNKSGTAIQAYWQTYLFNTYFMT